MTADADIDDVTVVGGGPAGALAALLLARRGWRVRLFDRARFPRPKLCGDTLNPGALATLSRHLDLGALRDRGLSLHGMRLSGPGGATIEGRYPAGVTGLSVTRLVLDAWLLDAASRAGVSVEDGVLVRGPRVGMAGVSGVTVATAGGDRAHPSRIVLGADGRSSALARACRLATTPGRPRRWALGAYATGVTGVDPAFGEMHVRAGCYVGISPVAGGVTNVCLVLPRDRAATVVADPWAAIQQVARTEPALAARFDTARPLGRPVVLGPMAVDAIDAGVPGLLLAGDAAGFVDPMTGDGLRLAIDGAMLAADVADAVLDGRVAADDAAHTLETARRAAFAGKWRFNRSVRALVDAPALVTAATVVARAWPSALAALVRYAGDVRRAA